MCDTILVKVVYHLRIYDWIGHIIRGCTSKGRLSPYDIYLDGEHYLMLYQLRRYVAVGYVIRWGSLFDAV